MHILFPISHNTSCNTFYHLLINILHYILINMFNISICIPSFFIDNIFLLQIILYNVLHITLYISYFKSHFFKNMILM